MKLFKLLKSILKGTDVGTAEHLLEKEFLLPGVVMPVRAPSLPMQVGLLR